ncbi:uncharacterized protein LOC143018152 isoform X3 [Oratosquilla oratoria]|uniref:uncharacterized protein LOC143018152 isoform X3 n=1 Tax=Oratosquilla oratoria TaxID=337810 RepID=UPI003F7689D4
MFESESRIHAMKNENGEYTSCCKECLNQLWFLIIMHESYLLSSNIRKRRPSYNRTYDPMDEWLDSQGLFRKHVAKDGSCLFRAVAEQIFMTQTVHTKVREACLSYINLHKEQFKEYLNIPVDHHTYNMRNPREWGGHVEMVAMSHLFKIDFLIYQDISKAPLKATENGHTKIVMLCYTNGNHYDIVYEKSYSQNKGFAQSLVYEMLYKKVFKLKDVQFAVDKMLHDREYAARRRDSSNSTELREIGAVVEKVLGTSRDISNDEGDANRSCEEKTSEDLDPDDIKGQLAHGIKPIPYRVAKSLDPEIYRNIEFDVWNTERREARFGPFDSNGFQAGVKVLIKLEQLPNREEVEAMRQEHQARNSHSDASPGASGVNHSNKNDKLEVFHGHIQRMSENKGPVDVFVEEIGARLKVPYDCLMKFPPSPSRSPLHQSSLSPSPYSNSGYKLLSGYYQKAPLTPPHQEYGGRNRKKGGGGGRQMRKAQQESKHIIPHTNAHHSSPHRSTSYSPQMRPHHSATLPRTGNFKPHSGATSSPVSAAGELETVHVVSSSPYGPVEGVWAHIQPPPPPEFSPQQSPPPVDVQSPVATPTAMTPQVAIQALQQVMSAGGQQVKVSGQQLEVVEKSVTSSSSTTPQDRQCSEEECVIEGETTQQTTPPTSHPPTTCIPPVIGNGDVAAVSPVPGAVYAMGYSYPGVNMMPMYPPVVPPPQQQSERTTDSPATNTSPVHEGEAPDAEAVKYNHSVMSYMFPVVYGYGMGYGQPWMFPVPMMPSPTAEDGKPVTVAGENCQLNHLSHDLQNVQLSGNQQEMVSTQASVMIQPPPPEVHPPPPPPPPPNSLLVHPPHTEAPPGPPVTHHHNPPLLPNPSQSPHHHHHPPLSMTHLPPPFPNPAMSHPSAVSCSVPHIRHLHHSPMGPGKSLDQRDGYRRGRGGYTHQGGRGGYNNNYHGPPNNNHNHHHHYGGPGRGGSGGPGGGQRSLPPRMQRSNGGSGGQRSAYEGQPLMLMSSTESLNSQTTNVSGSSVVSSPAVMYPMGELDGRIGPRPPSGAGGQLVGEGVEGGGSSEVFYSPDGTPMISPATYDANMYNGGYIPCYQAPPGYIMGPVGQWIYPPTYHPSPTGPHHHHPPHPHHQPPHQPPMPSAAYLQQP